MMWKLKNCILLAFLLLRLIPNTPTLNMPVMRYFVSLLPV